MEKIFLPSLIEVNFDEFYKNCTSRLLDAGFNDFHIDFGDQELIQRTLTPWNKVCFLKDLSSDIHLTAHIMSKSGSHSESVEKISAKCIENNFDMIYVHPRSFKNLDELKKFKESLFDKEVSQFGIVSEVDYTRDDELCEFINANSVTGLLQMGVPIGMGGQKFHWNSVEKIKNFHSRCHNLSIVELDGGLTFEVVDQLKNQNINRFSGWSLVNDKNPARVVDNALKLKEIL